MLKKLPKLKRPVALLMCIIMSYSLIASTLTSVFAAGSTSTLAGSNLALGSPLLESNFVSDDWNKWETVLWGIYLSNYIVPFLDDYETAFTSNSSGSEGSGLAALEFGTGSSASNSSLIQNLLTVAINYQKNSYTPISVAYSRYANLQLQSETGPFNGGVDTTGAARQAKVKDLFFNTSADAVTETDVLSTATWGIGSNGLELDTTDGWILNKTVNTAVEIPAYGYFVGMQTANLPTFAITGNNDKYEVVLDYRDSWDIQMMSASVIKAITHSDYREKATEALVQLMDTPLVMDAFGNICARANNRNIVLLQSSASQYITSSKTLNLVNSLVFNSSTPSADSETLMMQAGTGKIKANWFEKWTTQAKNYYNGSLAFTNGASGMTKGGMVLFYDTDTIVLQEYIKRGGLSTETIDNFGYLTELYDLDINDAGNKYQFKIEPVNVTTDVFEAIEKAGGDTDIDSTIPGGSIRDAVDMLITGSGVICNTVGNSTTRPTLTTLKQLGSTVQEADLFEDSTTFAVQLPAGIESGKYTWAAGARALSNFIAETYESTQSYGGFTVSKSIITSVFNDSGNSSLLTSNALDSLLVNDDKPTEFLMAFWSKYSSSTSKTSSLYKINDPDKLSTVKISGWPAGKSFTNALIADDSSGIIKSTMDDSGMLGASEISDGILRRTVKVYHTSEVLTNVAKVLGIRSGTDFGVYASNIYYTYIDWYGLKKDTLTGEYTSNFNENIFNDEILIEDVTTVDPSIPSEEEMQKEIINYTYLMLNPTAGRDYRNTIMLSGITDFLYEQYQRLVYGSSSSYNSGLVTTRNSTGFMSVDTYSENFFTAWFMDDYVTISVYLMIIGLVLTIIVGAIRREKFSWFMIAFIMIINVVLVIPTTGEIVPYLANNAVQNMFKDKMTYWSISEQVEASSVEQEAITSNSSGLTNEQWAQVYSLSSNIKSLYLDRYISVKQDISNKVTSTASMNYDEIQQLQTARWLLPMIMREFTNDESETDYVYVALSDKYENIANIYWFYMPEAAAFGNTINGASATTTAYKSVYDRPNVRFYADRETDFWGGETSTYVGDESDESLNYKSYAYTQALGHSESESYLTHLYSYILESYDLGDVNFKSLDYNSGEKFDSWAERYDEYLQTDMSGLSIKIDSVYQRLTEKAQQYDAYDRNTIDQSYGYLWTTESPLSYFYEVANETFGYDSTVAWVAANLQGKYTDAGHVSYLTDENGNTRDILDLENLFTNTIPYIYTLQLYTGGYDGTSGYYGTDTMGSDYSAHSNQLKSWIFRSNWAAKIMENRELNGSGTIYYYDANGTRMKATVDCMLMPYQYSEATGGLRQMVFSRAQMEQQGLTEFDLSEVELLCINCNEDTYQSWTLLLNYVATSGMTTQILFRQMAVDAWLTFNKTFTASSLSLGNSSKLYPTSLDLRSISFDSVMTMLMLNVTENTSYIYGDSMSVIIEDCDIVTAVLLLIVAWVCTFLIPLIRNFTLAVIFFLGYIIVAKSIIGSNTQKKQSTIGYLSCNLLYLLLTYAYYMIFKVLMAITRSDEVLTVKNIEVNTGNPMWCLLFVLAISVAYVVGSYFICKFVIINYKDMGYAAVKGFIELMSSNVSAGFESLAGKLTENSNASGSGSSRALGNGGLGGRNTGNSDGSSSLGGSGSGSGSGDSGGGSNSNRGVSEINNEDDLNSAASGINSRRGGGQESLNRRDVDGTNEINSTIQQGANSKADYDVDGIKTVKQAEKAYQAEQAAYESKMSEYQRRMTTVESWRVSAENEADHSSESYQKKMKTYTELKADADRIVEQAYIHRDNAVVINNKKTEIESRKNTASKGSKKSGSEATMDDAI